MAISTSPYLQNDYQAANTFRPYQLPINDIFKAISAQNAFWDAGAARVKSYYDNALDLKLSIAPNKEIRDQFMKDAEKEISKLSQGNLADPSVQRKGFNIFKPLFKDEGVMYDDLMTRHYDKVRNDALSYRKNNNGKGYSDVNLQYAMDGYEEFVNSTDRMAGKQFYQKRRDYTPYYDYTLDYERALKDCKPSSVSNTSPHYNDGNMTGYMKSVTRKFRSAAQTRNCIEAGISPNALRQLQIEGVVNYKGKKDVLASDTSTYLSGVSANLSEQLQELGAQKHIIQGDKNLNAQQKAVALQQLEEQMKGISNELSSNTNIISKLNSGDFSPLDENYDAYAGSVYSYRKIQKKAVASAFEEVEEEYKADPAQLQALRFQQEVYMSELDHRYDKSLKEMEFDHDKNMKLFDLMYGGKGKDGTNFKGKAVYINPVTGQIEINPTLQRQSANITDMPEPDDKAFTELNEKVSALNTEKYNNNLEVYNSLIERGEADVDFRNTLLQGFNYGTTDEDWDFFKRDTKNNRFKIAAKGYGLGGIQETSWFRAYSKLNPKDEEMNKWSKRNTKVHIGLNALDKKLELGERQVARELGFSEENASKILSKSLESIKPVVIDELNITAQDVQSAINGIPTKGITVRDVSFTDSHGITHTAPQIFLNGKENKKLGELYQKVVVTSGEVNSKISKKRAEVYGRAGFNREPWYFTYDDESELALQLGRLFPNEKGEPAKAAILLSDFSGGIKVSVPGGFKDAAQKIRSMGIGDSVEESPDGTIIIKGTNYNVVPQAINDDTMREVAFQLSSVGETREFKETQPGQRVKDFDIDIPITVNGEDRIFTIKTFKSGNSPQFKVYAKGPFLTTPIVSNNAFDLLEQVARLSSLNR